MAFDVFTIAGFNPAPGFSALALIVGLGVGRVPFSTPLPDLEFQRQMTAGSDALLERMVIPPNRPDWLLTDCGQFNESKSTTVTTTSFDRKRQALCEAAKKSNATARN